jgi:hypothetical protein
LSLIGSAQINGYLDCALCGECFALEKRSAAVSDSILRCQLSSIKILNYRLVCRAVTDGRATAAEVACHSLLVAYVHKQAVQVHNRPAVSDVNRNVAC